MTEMTGTEWLQRWSILKDFLETEVQLDSDLLDDVVDIMEGALPHALAP